MVRALNDFRVEDDHVVLLSFTDGGSYRVNPADLSKHLSRHDQERVMQAIKMRKQFITRVLPPTAIVLFISLISFGGVQYTSNILQDDEASRSEKNASVPIQQRSSVGDGGAVNPVTVSPAPGPAQQPASDGAAVPVSAVASSQGSRVIETAVPPVQSLVTSDNIPNLQTALPENNLPNLPVVNP